MWVQNMNGFFFMLKAFTADFFCLFRLSSSHFISMLNLKKLTFKNKTGTYRLQSLHLRMLSERLVWLRIGCSFQSNFLMNGVGCGRVGCTVAFDTRNPRFESWHQLFLYLLPSALYFRKRQHGKEKEAAGIGPSNPIFVGSLYHTQNCHSTQIRTQAYLLFLT